MSRAYKIMFSAGEASGDMHGANLLKALKGLGVKFHAYGMGGPQMAEQGMELEIDCREMSVVGIVEVLLQYRRLMRQLDRLKQLLERERPDLLVTIDYPGFNLKLAKIAKDLGIRVIHYISPQVWAWRAGRIQQIAAAVDRIAVLFPFEVEIYRRAGVPVNFVGHPLMDQVDFRLDAKTAKRTFRFDNGRLTVGLLPGSRNSEIERLLPILLETAQRLQKQQGPLNFILPLASTIPTHQVQPLLKESGLTIQLVQKKTHLAIKSCDAVITASGTATLEVGLLGIPMVIVYKVNGLSFAIARRLMKIPYIGLVNIVAGHKVVQEFLQGDAEPKQIANEVSRLLGDPAYHATIVGHLRQIRTKMGPSGASLKMAHLIRENLLELSANQA